MALLENIEQQFGHALRATRRDRKNPKLCALRRCIARARCEANTASQRIPGLVSSLRSQTHLVSGILCRLLLFHTGTAVPGGGVAVLHSRALFSAMSNRWNQSAIWVSQNTRSHLLSSSCEKSSAPSTVSAKDSMSSMIRMVQGPKGRMIRPSEEARVSPKRESPNMAASTWQCV